MHAMRSTEIVVTNVQLEKKEKLGSKRLPYTNLYLKYFREKFYFLNSSLESFMLPLILLTSRRTRMNEKKAWEKQGR